MARPKAFDRNEALAAAMGVCWAQGYAAASTHDLLAGMGISRQRFCDAFVSKRALYLEALKLYGARRLADVVARFLLCAVAGLRVAARAGVGPHALRDIAGFALARLAHLV